MEMGLQAEGSGDTCLKEMLSSLVCCPWPDFPWGSPCSVGSLPVIALPTSLQAALRVQCCAHLLNSPTLD